MTYHDASDEPCTAALMQAAQGFSTKATASAAATVLAQACAGSATYLRDALSEFDACAAVARYELEINFDASGKRRELS
jgi:hypothetical protein